jgi:glyoxylate/hydroxypyruvate reductase
VSVGPNSAIDALNIVSLVPLSGDARAAIEAVDPSIRLTMATGWFDGEIREAWGSFTADAFLRPDSVGVGSRADRDKLLAETNVVLGGFPPPRDLRARAPLLRWFHQTPAGASNLRGCDLWGSDVIVTTSRGLGNTVAIAEYVVAAFLHFSRGLDQAGIDRERGAFERSAYRPSLVAGKTVCVVGAGGIGEQVGRLCAALGMRVVGTRRSPGDDSPEGFEQVGGPDRLHELLAEAAFVAVCCQLTSQTEGLIGADALGAMPDGAVLVNVARGEIIDEEALMGAVDRMRGVALDVYVGEFDRSPPAALWDHPRVIITPHVSAGSEERSTRPIELFTENLGALLAGRPLRNRIDWTRGY